MFAIAFAFLLACQVSSDVKDQSSVSVDGVWHVVGNEYHGTLELKVDSDNILTGKIYGQDIKGKWYPNDKRFEFTRFELDKGLQVWEGNLQTDSKNPTAPMILSGKFYSIAGPQYGASDKSYAWTGARLGKDGLYIGMPALGSIVAQFVTGPKADKTVCPVLFEREETKIAIFAKQLNAPVLSLIQSIDEIVAATPKLKSSFVFLSHENAPTPTEADFENQLAEIKRLAAEKSIEHLAMGLMIRIPDSQRNTRARRSLGFFGDGDIVVMLIGPGKNRNSTMIRYFQVLNSESATGEIERVCKELRRAADER
jgi:hypothetical protein